ncbi:oligosaccharide flippase family protein [Dyadobacter tibetensis]|uniref:oligosaccharide flippase family protein n=1 Tax=Dyadobacter tibetensis TaxID=1211851 RepID=UPI00047123EA|nr:oligosaccharide flippase family protein [Dyadobacter tibetensis]
MSTYKSILKSTGLIALVQVVQLIFGLIRNKFIALFLGTHGFGIWGLYQTYIEMVSTFSTLGVDQSSVREIAKTEDIQEKEQYIYLTKITILCFSLIAAIFSIFFSKSISRSLFQSESYYIGIIIISSSIIFNGVSKGHKSILNGLRDMKGLALSQIIGSALGSIITISLVYWLGLEGIPWYLSLVGLSTLISTWWFLKRHNLKHTIISRKYSYNKIKSLLFLGLGFSITAIIAAFSSYFSRTYLSEAFNISTVGLYQASWTISNLYIGIILSAMGIDFMPRLVKVIDDSKKLTSLINEQMELGALISSIGVVFILLFSKSILEILYSSEFLLANDIIKWQVLGVALRVLGFPFSHAIMAKNKPIIYVILQAVFWSLDYILLVLLSKTYGVGALGVNYFVAYIVYLLLCWLIAKRLYNFHSTNILRQIVCGSFIFICAAWIISNYTSGTYLIFMAISILLIMAGWTNYYLSKHMNLSILNAIKKQIRK